MFVNEYPYTDFHELNLDWILRKIKKLEGDMDEFTALNKITFLGSWDIGKTYPAWSVVEVDGNGYVAIKPVPVGVQLDNEDYWQPIEKYSALYGAFEQKIDAVKESVEELKTEVEYLLPGGSASSPCGECLIVKQGEEGIVVDYGYDSTGNTLITTLIANGITKIKALMLTHFHDDHTGGGAASGFTARLNAPFDFSECKA